MRIRISHPFPTSYHLRQTPGSKGIWGDCQFTENQPMDPCDAWVVLEGLSGTETATCPRSRTVFVAMEPPSGPRYPQGFLAQFAAVLTSHQHPSHPNVIHRQQGLPWEVGVIDQRSKNPQIVTTYDDLAAIQTIEKTRNLSVICSSADMLASHRRRIRFVQILKDHFGDALDVFGRPWRPVRDKWEAIAPYRYHVAIENGQWPNYWSEKLADTFLAGAMPLYGGCPNISDYFDPRSSIQLDLSRPKQAIQSIERAIEVNQFEQSREHIWEARRRVLNEYNLFPMLANLCKSLPASEPERLTLRPGHVFPFSSSEKLKKNALRIGRNVARVSFRLRQRLRRRMIR